MNGRQYKSSMESLENDSRRYSPSLDKCYNQDPARSYSQSPAQDYGYYSMGKSRSNEYLGHPDVKSIRDPAVEASYSPENRSGQNSPRSPYSSAQKSQASSVIFNALEKKLNSSPEENSLLNRAQAAPVNENGYNTAGYDFRSDPVYL